MMQNLQQAMKRLERSMTARAARNQRELPPAAWPSPTDGLALDLDAPIDAMADLRVEQGHAVAVGLPTDRPSYPPLFRPEGPLRRDFVVDERVSLPGGGKISYRGESLHNDDHAVWRTLMTLLGASKSKDYLKRVEFAPRSFLKEMGWGASQRDAARLQACLERMQATVIKRPATARRASLALSLIARCEWHPSPTGRGGRWRVWIANDVQQLFAQHLN